MMLYPLRLLTPQGVSTQLASEFSPLLTTPRGVLGREYGVPLEGTTKNKGNKKLFLHYQCNLPPNSQHWL